MTKKPSLKECANCGKQIPQKAKFCENCGEQISDSHLCINCKSENPIDAKFCAQCGTSLTSQTNKIKPNSKLSGNQKVDVAQREQKPKCPKCRYYRNPLEIFMQLSPADDRSADVTQALQNAQETLNQKQAAEAAFLTRLLEENEKEWPTPPSYINYCLRPLDEYDEYNDNCIPYNRSNPWIALVAELENLGGKCTRYYASIIENADCDKCAHCVAFSASQTPEEKTAGKRRKDFKEMSDLLNKAIGYGPGITGSSPDVTGPIITSLHTSGAHLRQAREMAEAAASRQLAAEIQTAVRNDGMLPHVPEHFNWCKAWSEIDDDHAEVPKYLKYALCKVFNPEGICPLFGEIF